MSGRLGLLWSLKLWKISEKSDELFRNKMDDKSTTFFFLSKCTHFIPFFIQEVDIMSMLPNVRCIL
jgi:hypothetical protein